MCIEEERENLLCITIRHTYNYLLSTYYVQALLLVLGNIAVSHPKSNGNLAKN